jgi:hypothetical protein
MLGERRSGKVLSESISFDTSAQIRRNENYVSLLGDSTVRSVAREGMAIGIVALLRSDDFGLHYVTEAWARRCSRRIGFKPCLSDLEEFVVGWVPKATRNRIPVYRMLSRHVMVFDLSRIPNADSQGLGPVPGSGPKDLSQDCEGYSFDLRP